MSAAVSMASQPPTRRDILRPSSSRSSALAEVHHSDAQSSRPSSSKAAAPETRPRKASDSTTTANPDHPSSSRTSRRKTHNRGSSSTSTKHHRDPAEHSSPAAPPLPAKTHSKKLGGGPPPSGFRSPATSADIPNATPPSPRMPYFAMYPNRAVRAADASPYHSEDVDDTAGRTHFRGKAAVSTGAQSDGGMPSSSSFRSRSRAKHAGDDSDTEGAYAWPAKIPSSKLSLPHLQVPSSSSSSTKKTRGGDSSVTPSPMSSVSSSPSGGNILEPVSPPPLSSPPPRQSSHHHSSGGTGSSRLTDAIPSYGPYGRHKFPSIRDPPEFLSRRELGANGDHSLYVASGFEVSEMDALVASINGGEERGYSHVADLVHLSSSWSAPKGMKKTTTNGSSSKPSSNPSAPSSSSSARLHPHHSKHSKHSNHTPPSSSSSRQGISEQPSSSSLYASTRVAPPPSTTSSSTASVRSATKSPRPTTSPNSANTSHSTTREPSPRLKTSPAPTYHNNYSPTSPPSLSHSSGVSSDISAFSSFSTPHTTDRSVNNDAASQRSYGVTRKASDTWSSTGKTPVPSIADIIRAYAPEHLKKPKSESALVPPRSPVPTTTSPSSLSSGSGIGNSGLQRSILKMPMSTPVADIAEESESRSSIDSVAEEALRNVRTPPAALRSTRNTPIPAGPSTPSSPSSQPMTPTARSSHTFMPNANYGTLTNPSEVSFDSGAGGWTSVSPSPILPPRSTSPTHEMAQYLRSPRLTRLVKLRRGANAGMTVSLADVGSPTGRPALLFLGLGCVRYIIGLYDEMAEALGIRLICLDRWGLGRTSEVGDEKRGMLEWAGVVEEVMDTLGVGRFSIFAHSAGAPYALASALKLGERVHGSVHLLAPWVSQSVDGGEFTVLLKVWNCEFCEADYSVSCDLQATSGSSTCPQASSRPPKQQNGKCKAGRSENRPQSLGKVSDSTSTPCSLLPLPLPLNLNLSPRQNNTPPTPSRSPTARVPPPQASIPDLVSPPANTTTSRTSTGALPAQRHSQTRTAHLSPRPQNTLLRKRAVF